MKNKNIFLIAGILSTVLLIGYFSETEPHKIFGLEINIWIVRLFWALITVSNFSTYFKMKKSEAETK